MNKFMPMKAMMLIGVSLAGLAAVAPSHAAVPRDTGNVISTPAERSETITRSNLETPQATRQVSGETAHHGPVPRDAGDQVAPHHGPVPRDTETSRSPQEPNPVQPVVTPSPAPVAPVAPVPRAPSVDPQSYYDADTEEDMVPDPIRFRFNGGEEMRVSPAERYDAPPPGISNQTKGYEYAAQAMTHRVEYLRLNRSFSKKALRKNIGTRWFGFDRAPVTIVIFFELPNHKMQWFMNRTWPAFKHEYVDTGRVRVGFRYETTPHRNGDETYVPISETIGVTSLEVPDENYTRYLTRIGNVLSRSVDVAQDEEEIRANIIKYATMYGVPRHVVKSIWSDNYDQDSNGVARRMALQSLIDEDYYKVHDYPYVIGFRKNGDETRTYNLYDAHYGTLADFVANMK